MYMYLPTIARAGAVRLDGDVRYPLDVVGGEIAGAGPRLLRSRARNAGQQRESRKQRPDGSTKERSLHKPRVRPAPSSSCQAALPLPLRPKEKTRRTGPFLSSAQRRLTCR